MKQLVISLGMAVFVAFATLPVTYTDADARGMSRSSGFSRSSLRSSPSRSIRSPSKSRSSKSGSGGKKGGFWSNKGKKTGSIKTKTAKKRSATQQRQAKRTKNVLAAKRQKDKFKKQPTVPGLKASGKKPSRVAANRAYRDTYSQNKVYNRAKNYDNSTYYDRRNGYYGSGYQPPVYVYQGSSGFGMWDGIFLYHMMNSNNSAQFAHNHQNNPDYQAWRREAEELAKDNADLRKQLTAMDAGAAKLAGTPVNPDYLPEGVDADIALAAGARESTLPTMRVCVGSNTGAYFLATAGVMAPNVDALNIIPVTTAGTGQALQYITENKCDAAWVQSDGYWNYIEDNETLNLPFDRLFSPYREAVHIFCHEKGPSKISQMDDDTKLWFPAGSGAAVTFRNWLGEDDDYAEIQTVITKDEELLPKGKLNNSMVVSSNEEALMKVSKDKNSCMMYVAAPGATEFVQTANASAKALKIVLIDINDNDFNDTEDPSGADVYDFMELDERLYGNLTRNAGALWGGGDIHTLDMKADVIVSTAFQKKHAKIWPKAALQITALEPRIKAVVKPKY